MNPIVRHPVHTHVHYDCIFTCTRTYRGRAEILYVLQNDNDERLYTDAYYRPKYHERGRMRKNAHVRIKTHTHTLLTKDIFAVTGYVIIYVYVNVHNEPVTLFAMTARGDGEDVVSCLNSHHIIIVIVIITLTAVGLVGLRHGRGCGKNRRVRDEEKTAARAH